jgi:uncharacterized protein (DUF1800 family)
MLPSANTPWTIFEAAHLLNRAGFGGSPADIKAFHARGREKAVDFLISPPEPLDEFPLPSWTSDEIFQADNRERLENRKLLQEAKRTMSAEEADQTKREAARKFRQVENRRGLEAQGWWFRRMLKTEAPLREKMTLFWHDHFATSIQKVKQPTLLVRQNDLFRCNAFGSSRTLTQAVLLDPAMMLYLDTQSSKKGSPNENFAREVMELFTLGEGNYSEQDIRECARAFTGYQLNRLTGKVFHANRQWDDGSKTIFGKTGNFDGKNVIDMIFENPEAARFMTSKIWQFFVYENPPKAAIDSLAKDFQASDFNIGQLLRQIFLSEEFYSESAIRSQIKCPVQYLIALLKQLEIEQPPVGLAVSGGQQLGQVLFAPPNVAGWDWGKGWINTNTLLTRYNLAGYLTKASDAPGFAGGKGKDKTVAMMANRKRNATNYAGPNYEEIAPRKLRENPPDLVDSLIFRFFQGPVPDKARKTFVEYAISKKGAIFTSQETAELCHLILSTPFYQLC